MAEIGDSKGEYRGLAYRNDSELKAWLAKRPNEAALEPDLPIIDPHHHFWDTPQRGSYLLPELLADIGGGHNVVSTVFLVCQSMLRAGGPEEMRPAHDDGNLVAGRRESRREIPADGARAEYANPHALLSDPAVGSSSKRGGNNHGQQR